MSVSLGCQGAINNKVMRIAKKRLHKQARRRRELENITAVDGNHANGAGT
jgi:hypothetical protein